MSAYVGLYVGLHSYLATLADTPELAVSEQEAAGVLTAAQNVARHYSMNATQKTLDWAALGIVIASVYGPRIALMMQRKPKPTNNVYPFNAAE